MDWNPDPLPLSESQYHALEVLADGPARKAPWTRSDKAHGIHAIRHQDAKALIQRDLAKDLIHWKGCVEITEKGRARLRPRVV